MDLDSINLYHLNDNELCGATNGSATSSGADLHSLTFSQFFLTFRNDENLECFLLGLLKFN